MERDFLGVNKDFGELVSEELSARGRDGAFLGSTVRWPFSNKTAAMRQQYMSSKVVQEERQKKFSIDQFPTSGGFQPMTAIDSFETSQKNSVVVSSQKLDRQVIHQFPIQTFQPESAETYSSHQLENRTFPVISHYSVPAAPITPFPQVHGAQNNPNISVASLNQLPYGINTSSSGAGSTYGAFPPRNMPKSTPTTAQMTIFYAGTVNVYDDIPFEKAQKIMLFASKGSNADSDVVKLRCEVPVQASVPFAALQTVVSCPTLRTTISAPMFQTRVQAPILQAEVPLISKIPATNGLNSKVSIPAPIRIPSPCSVASSPISVTSRLGTNSGSVSSTVDDLAGPKILGPSTSTSPQEISKSSNVVSGSTTAADAIPRAVPQARKASLARFLEKRKERVINVMPYSFNKINTESGVQFDSAKAMNLSSSTNVNISNKIADSWCFEQSRSRVNCDGDSPSTKLEM